MESEDQVLTTMCGSYGWVVKRTSDLFSQGIEWEAELKDTDHIYLFESTY